MSEGTKTFLAIIVAILLAFGAGKLGEMDGNYGPYTDDEIARSYEDRAYYEQVYQEREDTRGLHYFDH